MSAPPITELTARTREIFRLVVEGYLASGLPVGSKALASAGGLNLSPASIRSVLADLEGLGLLAAPHTSAGRMPGRGGVGRSVAAPGPIEAALAATSGVLSALSAWAGLVRVPRREPRIAQLSLVPLSPGRALAVLVGEDGGIENRVVDLADGTPAAALEQASNYITARLCGRTLGDALRALRAEIASGRTALDAASRDLVERGLVVWSEDAGRRPVLIVRGQANLLDDVALGDIERVRSLLDDLENKQSVAELLESAREAEATRIFIGSENRLFAPSGSSGIAPPHRDREGKGVGVVGVIGPTRLNYARLVPMVDFTAQSLGKLIG